MKLTKIFKKHDPLTGELVLIVQEVTTEQLRAEIKHEDNLRNRNHRIWDCQKARS